MAPFSSIPNELLEHILDHVMPEDLENFAQTSKHIRSLSTAALKNHRRLIRRFSIISGPSISKNVEPVLKAVLANPRIGHYVKKIQIDGVAPDNSADLKGSDEGSHMNPSTNIPAHITGDGWTDSAGDDSLVPNVDTPGVIKQIQAAIVEGKLLDPRRLAQIYNNVRAGDNSLSLILLLPILPNLTVLSLLGDCYPLALYSMLKQAKEHGIRILSHLDHIQTLSCKFEYNHNDTALDGLEIFLLLPSLRKLTIGAIWQIKWSRAFFDAPQPSNITELELSKCNIDSTILVYFLRHFPHLQTFLYTFDDNYFEDEYREVPDEYMPSHCNPWIICTALQAQVPTTLRKLTVLVGSNLHDPTFMGPLCGFKALEYVHSEPGCLLPYENSRGAEKGIFSSTLPISLRTLKVRCHGREYTRDYQRLIDHAVQGKTDRNAPLRHLESLVFEMTPELASKAQSELQNGIDGAWQERCDELGMSLHVRARERNPYGDV